MIKQLLTRLAFFALLTPATSYSQQTVVEKYEYDALGRLKKVTEGSSVKVAYCYDPAGNRVKVNAGNTDPDNCEAAVPVPPVPTNVQQSTHMGGGCYMYWTEAGGNTAFYQIRLTNSSTVNINAPASYYDHNTLCAVWIRACNSDGDCSAEVNI